MEPLRSHQSLPWKFHCRCAHGNLCSVLYSVDWQYRSWRLPLGISHSKEGLAVTLYADRLWSWTWETKMSPELWPISTPANYKNPKIRYFVQDPPGSPLFLELDFLTKTHVKCPRAAKMYQKWEDPDWKCQYMRQPQLLEWSWWLMFMNVSEFVKHSYFLTMIRFFMHPKTINSVFTFSGEFSN